VDVMALGREGDGKAEKAVQVTWPGILAECRRVLGVWTREIFAVLDNTWTLTSTYIVGTGKAGCQ
jgi:hypothetical protein